MTFKEDILKRIRTDFGASSEEAFTLLASAIEKTDELKTDRVIRCIIFLSKGNIAELHKFIQMAVSDPRDVLFAAEYRDHNNQHTIRIRDFNHPFDDCEKKILL